MTAMIQKNMEKVGKGSTEEGKASSCGNSGAGKFASGNGYVNQHWGHSTKLEFCKFNGEELEGRVLRAKYFFDVANVAAEEKVKIVALHLERRALQWRNY
ncbi:hypothetical protein GH714_010924 [Hevea brasiliensis]|uniref:Uncharacterized protein n=1 Tax=Hevea brasiliensis TaxID=3981 RepID=A0A6A6M4H2_HEVBR|nr:hypothetical protein GH714_010924 [Hevea brasiliensis]